MVSDGDCKRGLGWHLEFCPVLMLGSTVVSLRGEDSSGLEMVVALQVSDYNLMGAKISRMGLEKYLFHEETISWTCRNEFPIILFSVAQKLKWWQILKKYKLVIMNRWQLSENLYEDDHQSFCYNTYMSRFVLIISLFFHPGYSLKKNNKNKPHHHCVYVSKANKQSINWNRVSKCSWILKTFW